MTTQSRTVRVFLSSTFRDFAEERDLLVRTIFPELRRRCRERQVELVDVDLRWGITEEEAQNGSVLSICLAEIDRARPYFMGFIGERYGWVPEKDKYDAAIVQEQPWLEEHRGGKSVTELEMLHGVLNNPAMAGRAFFYFRDSKWSGKKGGAYLSEGTQEKSKLEELKDRIRKSGFPVVENYPTPEKLAERVREDLWSLIDEAFPESEVPDALTMERRRHEAYTLSRIRLYLGGESYFTALDKAMDACKPVLITGQSGGGKSALIANWFLDWSSKHPKAAVIVHHLGCGSDAADPVRMAVRIMQEIAIVTGDEFKHESDPDRQLDQLPLWLATASAWAQRENKEVLIVLDGLDKLSDREHLRWFPAFLPPQVRLVASCLDGEILEATKTRLSWVELKVKAFTKAEQSRFITEYLGRYRKKLTAPQAKTLQSHPLSGNPLFLMTVLEELRVFGVHEELEQRLATLLSLPSSKAEGDEPTVDDVFEHVLARVEADLGKKPVQQAMEAIWASRSGLYQDELLAIAKLVPAQWAAIQNALDESIYESGGKISFGHDYLRKAVEDRYGLTGKKKLKLHRKLAEWFSTQEVDARVAEELPWQYSHGNKLKSLKAFLINLPYFSLVLNNTNGNHDAAFYWKQLGGESRASIYAGISFLPINDESFLRILDSVLDFFAFCGWHQLGLTTLKRQWGSIECKVQGHGLGSLYVRLASLLVKNARYDEAYEIIGKCRTDQERQIDSGLTLIEAELCRLIDDPKYAVASVWCHLKKLTSESAYITRCKSRELLSTTLDVAKLIYSSQDYRGDGWRLLEKCLTEVKLHLGDKDPLAIESQICIALAYLDHDDPIEAESMLSAAYSDSVALFGSESTQAHRCSVLLGYAWTKFEETKRKGWKWLSKSVSFYEGYYGSKSLELAEALEFFGNAKAYWGQYREAAGLSEQVLRIRKPILPQGHPKVCRVVYNLACYECLSGKTEEAKRLITGHLRLHPEETVKALADEDLSAIHEVIRGI